MANCLIRLILLPFWTPLEVAEKFGNLHVKKNILKLTEK